MFLLVDCSDGITVAISGRDTARNPRYDNYKDSAELPRIIQELDIDFRKITAIGAVVGPGSFTGIRIAIAWAKGAAIALGVPVIPISRLEVALRKNPDALIAIDNKKDGWFVQSKDMSACSLPADEIPVFAGMTIIKNPELDIDTAFEMMEEKINSDEPVIPLYLKPHYAEDGQKRMAK
jgi:tRNA A37 threonylcarbamoyladenosine modification protein TsaB